VRKVEVQVALQVEVQVEVQLEVQVEVQLEVQVACSQVEPPQRLVEPGILG
jgi:hypothetical protein